MSAAERSAIFEAAGFEQHGTEWRRCDDEPVAASSTPGKIQLVDLNGDGTPEAFVTETSLSCYGSDEGFVALLSKGKNGAWRIVIDAIGTYRVRKKKHGGWADVAIGGPGTGPAAVYRWNGTGYARSK
jgi:hypothetical protein